MKINMIKGSIIVLFLAFLITRIVFLLTFPLFNDESIHIRWGQVMIQNSALSWASMQYLGKQPLVFWFFGFFAKLFGQLAAARIPVLIASIPSFFLLYYWIKRLESKKIALVVLILFTFSPLFMLFQTLALMEGFLLTISLGVLFLLTEYHRRFRWRFLIMLGILISCGLWIKTNMVVLAIATVITVIVIDWQRKTSVMKMICHIIVLVLINGIVLTPLLTHPDFRSIINIIGIYSFSTAELLRFPVQIWTNNLLSTIWSTSLYATPVFTFLVIVGIITGKRARVFPLVFLFMILLMPTVLVGKIYTTRYFFFALAPLFPLMAMGIKHLLNRKFFSDQRVQYSLLLLCVSYSAWFILSPPNFFRLFPAASIVAGERDYAHSTTSGYGLPEIISYVESEQHRNKNIILAVADIPGNPTDYLLAYYYFNPQVKVVFATTTEETAFKQLKQITDLVPVTLITRYSFVAPEIKPYLTEIKRIDPPGNKDSLGIYSVKL